MLLITLLITNSLEKDKHSKHTYFDVLSAQFARRAAIGLVQNRAGDTRFVLPLRLGKSYVTTAAIASAPRRSGASATCDEAHTVGPLEAIGSPLQCTGFRTHCARPMTF